jgi:ribose/xylose/arabinose/galactoside ABC-type transport system permease subunit
MDRTSVERISQQDSKIGVAVTGHRIYEVWSKYGVLFLLFLLGTFMSLTSPYFLTVSNLLNIVRQVSLIGLIATGEFFVILTCGIDISAGSIVALTGVLVAGLVAYSGIAIPIAIMCGPAIGAIAGSINGYAVSKRRIPPFIATLGMMQVGRGIAYLYTKGYPITGIPQAFQWLGRGYIGGIPVPVIVLIIVFLAAYVLSTRTKFGRYLYAIGGSEEAARLSGVNVERCKFLAYVLCGALTGLSGTVLLGRLASGDPSTGLNFEFDAITAVVLGGVSINGGEGSMRGVILGTLFIGVLSNGMNLLNVSSYLQMVVKGLTLALAVGIDVSLKRD